MLFVPAPRGLLKYHKRCHVARIDRSLLTLAAGARRMYGGSHWQWAFRRSAPKRRSHAVPSLTPRSHTGSDWHGCARLQVQVEPADGGFNLTSSESCFLVHGNNRSAAASITSNNLKGSKYIPRDVSGVRLAYFRKIFPQKRCRRALF